MAKKFKIKPSARLLRKKTRRSGFGAAKHCKFCGNAQEERNLDYKNTHMLKGFLTERGKILPSRISGNCCFHQRQLAHEIKKARTMALVAYHAPNY
jgi:small subunit ribosomal protein S18